MSLKKKWRVRCTTDDVHKYVVQDSIDPQPTECPDDNSHTIDSNSGTGFSNPSSRNSFAALILPSW